VQGVRPVHPPFGDSVATHFWVCPIHARFGVELKDPKCGYAEELRDQANGVRIYWYMIS